MRNKLGLVTVLAVALLAGDALAQQPKYVLRFSSPNSKDHAWGRGAEKFKQLVAEGARHMTGATVDVNGGYVMV